jgi:hypothetical protein
MVKTPIHKPEGGRRWNGVMEGCLKAGLPDRTHTIEGAAKTREEWKKCAYQSTVS